MSELSIALLTYSTKPRGGVVHTLCLAEALAAAGQRVTVWALGRGGDTGFFRPVDPAVRQEVVALREVPGEDIGTRIRRSIATLRAAFDPDRYDVVHAQDCISANAVDRCIRTVHHIDHFTTPELVACHERAIVAPYAHVCVSAAVARDLRDGWGIAATVIPNGVEAQRFSAASDPATEMDRARWRARLGRYVLTVGGIEPRKGSLDLLDAYALLRRYDPGPRLVIAGGETLFDYREYRAQWQHLADRLNLEPVVLGPVAHGELPSLVAAASAFAFPSTREGFGLAAMEALAAGVPVVVRDLPVLREVFGDTVQYGTDPSSLARAIRRSIAWPDPRRRQAGRVLARAHTWSIAADKHIELYRSFRPQPGIPASRDRARNDSTSRRHNSTPVTKMP